MESIENRIASSIRNIPDFPQPGIQFKDITPLFMQPSLCKDIISLFAEKISKLEIDVIAGLETRGYLLGMILKLVNWVISYCFNICIFFSSRCIYSYKYFNILSFYFLLKEEKKFKKLFLYQLP